jgi:hypothetical protein
VNVRLFGSLPLEKTKTYNIQKRHHVVFEDPLWFPTLSLCRRLFSKSENFSMAKKAQVEKATKAMFEVLKRGKIHNLSIQCQLDLFDKEASL